MKKKTVLIHSNFCRAFTGFGKNKKNLLRYLFDTGKYNLIEVANGIEWQAPQTNTVPWTCRGALPTQGELQSLNPEQQRAEGYGNKLIDRAIAEFKPDVYIGIEDIWAFGGYSNKPWWNKINTMVWTTLDSLPILPQAVDFAPKLKHYYVWASFAEKALNDMGYSQVKTLRGSLDTSHFFRFNEEDRKKLRTHHGLSDEYIIGFVFRNQLRKSVPNLLDGFKIFKEKHPKSKLLLHTHWSEGWDIMRMLEEKNISTNDVLTTYVCSNCSAYSISPFVGQERNCNKCGSQKTLNTTNTSKGVSEEQLNEVYNLMDVYCHPFTSGGQEIPIQEAKLTELITLVTNYSCGEDSCSPESGGLPLEWSEYREPGTQFIKASTCPQNIAARLEEVYNMDNDERVALGKKSREWVIENFSVKAIGSKLEKIIDEMPDIDYDFNLKKSPFNANYTPELKDLLDKDDQGKRIAVVIPDSETDVLLINSLLQNLKKIYKKYNIYFFTKPQYFCFVDDNPNIHKLMHYHPILENSFLMEGSGNDKGLFEIAFYPHATTQKHMCYTHNGADKLQFSLR
jgi:glycosyltransferase involved in cell wall biosynthesis